MVSIPEIAVDGNLVGVDFAGGRTRHAVPKWAPCNKALKFPSKMHLAA